MENQDKSIPISLQKSTIEALLFISGNGLTITEISNTLNQPKEHVELILNSIIDDFAEREGGILIIESAGKYQFKSSPIVFNYIRNFINKTKQETLSKSSLEVLAIIAYKQPITRFEIDELRGTKSNLLIRNLLTKKLIKTNGQKDIPGKPFLYETTKEFLHYFELSSLNDLPPMQELKELKLDDL